MCLLSPFGESGGRSVPLISLQGPDGLALEAIGYGAALRRLTVPDRGGRPTDVCLGYDTLREYEEQDGCLGAVGSGAAPTGLRGRRCRSAERFFRSPPTKARIPCTAGPPASTGGSGRSMS